MGKKTKGMKIWPRYPATSASVDGVQIKPMIKVLILIIIYEPSLEKS